MADRNNGITTDGRNSDGTFAAGNPGCSKSRDANSQQCFGEVGHRCIPLLQDVVFSCSVLTTDSMRAAG